MKYAGIIAEYDPFHNGHAWQLAEARALGAQRIAVAMSCGLTQRGALPLLPEAVRAEAALRCGADLVFALPAPFACAGAETFARAGVRLLAAAGCDTLVFGAETPDASLLMETARVLCGEPFRTLLKEQLASGARSFAAARQAAAEAARPGLGIGALLALPNNNLAVEYCRAILEQNASLVPVALPRVGAQHNGALGEGSPRFASASALRRLWLEARQQPQPDLEALAAYLPEAALPLYRAALAAGQDTDPAAAGLAQLTLLRARLSADALSSPAPFAWVRGVSEGLEHRLENAVREAVSAPALYDALTTVRYPRARMRRLCMDAALGYAAGEEALPALPPYLHLLGARRSALSLLDSAALPAGTSLKKLAAQSPACARTAAAQTAAADFGALCRRTPAPMGLAQRHKLIVLPE